MDQPDAGSPDAGAADAAPPTDAPSLPCDPEAPFGAPIELVELNSVANDWNLALSADQLTAWVSSDHEGGGFGDNDVYVATRAATGAAFGDLAPAASLNSATHEFLYSLTADGLTAYLISDRYGPAPNWDIYVATRPSTAATFGPPALVTGLDTSLSEMDPFVTGDGDRIYLARDPEGDADLFRVAREPSGAFGVPVALDELNTAAREAAPQLTPDELTLYFSRDEDIFVARRDSVDAPFGEPDPVAELNTSGFDRVVAISPDGCTLWIVSNGHEGSGGIDIFTTSRPAP